ncbi:ShlB/FhaC/HecB family hemolysin secretion/activation protein [Pseudomonas citronellolis]|uniref:ShlB/FhaC/HecB family hemolysin secretion/activation protein n=1 Tax=Pseudomonas citronellolis TaxID=53408 RepID=UPI00211123D6|nr:ShlB/FhaC/HecB family hemolysin secretion/activation protein [Pseudomonas citronellolis]UUC53328.1 ShlB/FhaC/HecB family hemolysin secretion/activation protein [Pseudomonas citronellolis]
MTHFLHAASERFGRALLPMAIALAGTLTVPQALAESLPSAGQLLNEQQRTQPPRPQSTQPPAGLELPVETRRPGDAGLRVRLNAIRFSGDTDLASAENLQQLLQPMLGKTLDHAGLQQLVDSLTRYLRGRGYVLARAYLPRQDLTEGNLEIALIKGRLESGAARIQVGGNTRSSPRRLADMAGAALPEGKVLQAEDLERALLLINDQPGISAHAALERGAEPGSSRLLIDARQGPLVSGAVSLDNYGNRSTGIARANAQLSLNDPLAIGDQLNLGVSKTTGSDIFGAGYSLPLNASGLRLQLGTSYLRYDVDQDKYRVLDLRGTASTGSIGLSYPLLRSRLQNLYLSGTYEHKNLKDRALGANLRDRSLDNFTFALNGNRFDSFAGGGVSDAGVALTLGKLDLSGNRDDAFADSRSARSDGHFEKLDLRLSRLQSLGAGSDWNLYAGMSAQWSDQNLDSAEKFLLGGPAGVRAYPVGEAAGDEGWLGTLELRRNLPIGLPNAKLEGLGFFDSGRVWLHQDTWPGSTVTATGRNRYDLNALGLGANLWVGQWSLHAAVARTLGDNLGRSLSGQDADGRASDWRGWIQASLAF